MLNQEQINATYTFADTVGAFINRDGVLLHMDRWQDGPKIHNAFSIYGQDNNKYYFGQISFLVGASDFDCFIDGEIIHYLKSEGWM